MRVFDASTIAPSTARLSGFDAPVNGLAFSDAGLLGVALGDGTVRLMSPDGMERAVQAHDGASLRFVLDVDGAAFLSGGDDGRLVRVRPDGEADTLLAVSRRQVDALAVSRAGRVRAVAIGRQVRLLAPSGTELARSDDHPSTVTDVAFNARGKRLAAAHYDGVTLWWTASLGQSPTRLPWRGSHLRASWSPDGAYLVTSTQECELHAWHLASGRDVRMSGYDAKVRSLDWLAKPPLLLSSGAPGVTAWPFGGTGPQGKPPLEAGPGVGDLVTRVAAHPLRPLAGMGFSDGQVAVCAMTGDFETVRLRANDGNAVTALGWSPDGCHLAIGTAGGVIASYDLTGPGRR